MSRIDRDLGPQPRNRVRHMDEAMARTDAEPFGPAAMFVPEDGDRAGPRPCWSSKRSFGPQQH